MDNDERRKNENEFAAKCCDTSCCEDPSDAEMAECGQAIGRTDCCHSMMGKCRCFLRCHGRIIENLLARDKPVQFDALSVYRKYTDVFDIDDVPQEEQKQAAGQVADAVLSSLRKGD